MNLTDALDLVGVLLIIAAAVAVVLIIVPFPWSVPVALAWAGILFTVLSIAISKRGAR